MKDVQQTHSKHLIYDIVEVFATYTWYGMLHKYQCLSKIPAKKNVFEELKKGEQEKSGQKIRVFCNNWNIMLDNFLLVKLEYQEKLFYGSYLWQNINDVFFNSIPAVIVCAVAHSVEM